MNVNGFTAHQESIHGKPGEVMRMLALDMLVLHDVSVAVVCQKEDGGLLKAATGLTRQAERATDDISIAVRSPWAQSDHHVLLVFVGETEQIQRLG